MSDLFEELAEGEIHVRDKFQFELKSEYHPIHSKQDGSYTVELYLFVPNALQINPETYSESQFYRDQTSLIRYKTPLMTLEQLLEDDPKSPLVALQAKLDESASDPEILYELKLFANIVRSRLRDEVRDISSHLHEANTPTRREDLAVRIGQLLDRLEGVKERMKGIYQTLFVEENRLSLRADWDYIDEYLSVMIEHYLTSLLDCIRHDPDKVYTEVDHRLCQLILLEGQFRKKRGFHTTFSPTDPDESTRAIYRLSLLNKYIFEVLFLQIFRKEPRRRFSQIAAMVAAGVAMTVYLGLLAWHSDSFLINSTPFIALAVLLYVLKDRLKEGIRNFSTKIASRLYPDYVTDIFSPHGIDKIGRLSEYFSFLDPSQVPDDVLNIREGHFHDDLEKIRRQETVIYFKKVIEIYPKAVKEFKRLRHVNDIFRFNISQFLQKASDASAEFARLEPASLQLEHVTCSKLYHINIVLRRSFVAKGDKRRVEFDKFRIILDKEGIKKIEKL